LSSGHPLAKTRPGFIPKGENIEKIDKELTVKIPGYTHFDATTQSALRSAELPYLHREMFDEYVDKGSSLVEYCKAVDLHLENILGKKLIFPKLEKNINEFQNVLYAVGLKEEYPNAHFVLKQMGLEKYLINERFPFKRCLSLHMEFGRDAF
jgi:hypothetical protein